MNEKIYNLVVSLFFVFSLLVSVMAVLYCALKIKTATIPEIFFYTGIMLLFIKEMYFGFDNIDNIWRKKNE